MLIAMYLRGHTKTKYKISEPKIIQKNVTLTPIPQKFTLSDNPAKLRNVVAYPRPERSRQQSGKYHTRLLDCYIQQLSTKREPKGCST